MTSATLDRLLAVLVVALAATGLVSLRMGAPGDGWLFVAHGVLGGTLAMAVAAKVGRSMPRAVRRRRWGRVALGLLVTVATAAALVGGFAWVVSGRLLSIGSWTILTVHAWIGLALVPLVLVHLMPRRWRLLLPRGPSSQAAIVGEGRGVGAGLGRTAAAVVPARPILPLSRRRLLVGGLLGAGSAAIFGAAELANRIAGGSRRFTGSRWLPAGVPPPTTFYGEEVPHVDAATWRLRVHGKVPREIWLSMAELPTFGETEQTAILDCTSGWVMAASWRGVPLRTVLDAAGWAGEGRSVLVRSITGWATSLGRVDVDRSLLATGVAGGPLPAANGAPCRLVVPDRRGLDWVKWVVEVEVV